MLAKLEMAKAELRIKRLLWNLWPQCTTFVYADGATPYLTEVLELGAVVVRFGQATRSASSPKHLIPVHNSVSFTPAAGAWPEGFLELPCSGTVSNKSVKGLQIGH